MKKIGLIFGVVVTILWSNENIMVKDFTDRKIFYADSIDNMYYRSISSDDKYIIGASVSKINIWNRENAQLAKFYELDKKLNGSIKKVLTHKNIMVVGLNTIINRHFGSSVQIWDIEKNILIKTIDTGKDTSLDDVKISDNGKYLLTASHKSFKLWDFKKQKLLKKFKISTSKVEGIDISNDGKYIVLASVPNMSKNGGYSYNSANLKTTVWDVKTGKVIKEMKLKEPLISNDGMFVVGTKANKLYIWNRITDKLHKIKEKTDYISSFDIDNKREEIVSAEIDGTVKTWDIKTGALKRTFKKKMKTNKLVISTSGKYILTNFIKLWDYSTGDLLQKYQNNQRKTGYLSLSKDGSFFISAAFLGKKIQLWDIKKSQLVKSWEAHEKNLGGVILSEDNQDIISYSRTYGDMELLKTWSVKEQNLVKSFKFSVVYSSVFIPNSSLLIAGSRGAACLELYNMDTAEKIDRFESNFKNNSSTDVHKLSISADGSLLAVVIGNGDNRVELWDVKTGKYLKTFNQHGATTASITPDNKHIISGGYVHEPTQVLLELSDIKTKKVVKQYKDSNANKYRSDLHNIDISKDGKYILSVTNDDKVRLWDLEKTTLLKTFDIGKDIVEAYISADSNFIIVATWSGEITFWDIKNSKQPLKEFISGVDGKWIVFDYVKNKLYTNSSTFMYKKKNVIVKKKQYLTITELEAF